MGKSVEHASRASEHPTPPELAERARAFAEAHARATRQEALFQRAESVVEVLRELELDEASIAAALLHYAIPRIERDTDALKTAFGSETLQLMEGLERASQIERLSEGSGAAREGKLEGHELEGVRKMLLAMAEDVRVVLIKLAERVALVRSLTKASPEEQRAAGRQTLDLFAPLANRLGLSQVKWELEDYAFRFLEPDLYKRIASMLDEKRVEREEYILRVIMELKGVLEELGVHAVISGRPKHIYSIWRKMRGKKVDFDHLYDIRAVRVIVDSVRDCYAVLGVVHERYRPIEGEFDDYIAQPKANNYRSLHTAVIGPEDKTLEVQIRTRDMHEFNEHGVAAHWRYKEGGNVSKSDERFDSKISWLRQMLDFRQDLAGRVDATSIKDLFDDTVYVLTPQGRVVALPRGSTPIDFAYHVHTDLGHRCRGAKVNGHIVPLTYALQNADSVEIQAAKTGGPSRDWLMPQQGYLHSPRALSKVRAWFKHQEAEREAGDGRTILERELARLGRSQEKHERVMEACGFGGMQEFCIALARGEVTPRQIEIALGMAAPVEAPPEIQTVAEKTNRGGSGVLVLGVNNIATMAAKCCKPVPPDAIIGFVTRTRGVMVHRQDCSNITALRDNQKDRLLPADWGDLKGALFNAEIEVIAGDRQGLLRDISEAISREKVNVIAVNTISKGTQAFMRFTVQITGADIIERVKRAVGAVPDVQSVTRR